MLGESGIGDFRTVGNFASFENSRTRLMAEFQRIPNVTVSQLGATVQSGRMSAEASAAIKRSGLKT